MGRNRKMLTILLCLLMIIVCFAIARIIYVIGISAKRKNACAENQVIDQEAIEYEKQKPSYEMAIHLIKRQKYDEAVAILKPLSYEDSYALYRICRDASEGLYEGLINRFKLTSFTLPSNTTSIRTDAFAYCESLTAITIPKGVSCIGDRAFCACSHLTSVTVPHGVTSIGDRAFYGCARLTSITLPDTVTDIGEYAFLGSYSADYCIHIRFGGTRQQWQNIKNYSEYDTLRFIVHCCDGILYG